MTRHIHINVPEHVENEAAYIRGAQRRIQANAMKGRAARWQAKFDDAEKIKNFLFAMGEFAGTQVERTDEYGDVWGSNEADPIVLTAARWNFYHVLRDAIVEYGGLTDKQHEAAQNILAKAGKWTAEKEQRIADAKERDAGSEYVGKIKERRDFTLKIRKVLQFEGRWGFTFLHIMNDADENVFIYKGTKRLGEDGDEVTFKATIKAHEEREGVKQTIVTRPFTG